MEESRLKPMAKGYDPIKFEKLYNKTEGLRRKLAAGINPHKFGFDYEEILSWFSIKFIHVFNKYYDKDEDLLLGDIINSLKNFSYRIMRKSYTVKFSQSIIRIGSTDIIEHLQVSKPYYDEDTQDKLNQIRAFMKDRLTDNAYILFEIQNNPPPFILNKLNSKTINSINKIPDALVCEYLDIEYNDRAIKYLSNLKKEIKNTINYAKYHFSNLCQN